VHVEDFIEDESSSFASEEEEQGHVRNLLK
jgi:hypothetical protein